MSDAVPYLDAEHVARACSPRQAVDAIVELLRGDFDPADDPARSRVDMPTGQLLLMPAHFGGFAGVKVATVTPDNPSRGLPRIQARYLVFDAATLSLQAELDGTALTTLRTPAVSFAAVEGALARCGDEVRVVVFGAGPQAFGHLDTLMACLEPSQRLVQVAIIVRQPDRVLVPARYRELAQVLAVGDAKIDGILATADLVVCTTTSSTPVFDSALVSDKAVVIAVGSHDPDAREVDSELCARALVIVESIDNAMRECGDVVMAVDEGKLHVEDLVTMKSVAMNGLPEHDGPIFFKSCGMSWQDLVVASTVVASA